MDAIWLDVEVIDVWGDGVVIYWRRETLNGVEIHAATIG